MIDTETYQIYGVEALLRFHDQELKEGYPLLEKSGLIILSYVQVLKSDVLSEMNAMIKNIIDPLNI